LIKNAIKYTPSGGKILVGCRRVSSGIRIEVHDTGIGIAESNMYKIFNAFERLESGVPEGLGLGLFIVRHAAASLGHRVDVRSTEGKGSCFSVEIDAP
jgi:signal transduction histidine kinase